MELKKLHPSRLVGRVEMWNNWSHIHEWWVKLREGYLRIQESQLQTRAPSPEFQFQEDKFP